MQAIFQITTPQGLSDSFYTLEFITRLFSQMLRLSNFTISCEFLQKLSRKAKEIGGSPSYTWSSKDELLSRKISR